MKGPAIAAPRRASSSITAIAATMSRPLPPYASSIVRPQTPSAARRSNTARSNVLFLSHSRSFSRGISAAANFRSVSRSWVMCSGSSVKYTAACSALGLPRRVDRGRQCRDLGARRRDRVHLAAPGLVDAVDADHGVQRHERALDARKRDLQLLLGGVDDHARALTEEKPLDLDEAEEIALPDPLAVDL